MDDVFGNGLDQTLWIPPSVPYYGPTRQVPPLTKALIFSSWSMVPDAIAAILSYEAERRMGVGEAGRRYFDTVRPRPSSSGKIKDGSWPCALCRRLS